jgi:hypothetical protein
MDQNLEKLTDGTISDVSRTGCRVTSEEVSTLPDDLYIEIPGLTEPVKARIVKREDNMAVPCDAMNNGCTKKCEVSSATGREKPMTALTCSPGCLSRRIRKPAA